MKNKLISIALAGTIFLSGCAGKYYNITHKLDKNVMTQLNKIYPSWHERSMCVKRGGGARL